MRRAAPRTSRDGAPRDGGARLALTFDDGPSPWTGEILEALEDHGARATFFVLGCAIEGREAVLRRLVAAGCEIGIHGYSHRPLTTLSNEGIRDEMRQTVRLVEAATGRRPRLWRAPRLLADTRVRAVCAGLRLREVWVTADTRDYLSGADEVIARAVTGLHHRAILLLHDGRAAADAPDESLPDRVGTVAAVPQILREARRRGFRVVTVSEVLRPPLRALSHPSVLWAASGALVRG